MFTSSKTPVMKSSKPSSHQRSVQSESDRKIKNYTSPNNSGFNFAEIPLFPVQPKLKVNTPGDKFEQEADRMADQVTRMPENKIIQRKCDKCEEEGEEEEKKEKETIHDFTPKKGGNACACLVHIHNDERNSKAVARLLHSKCNYNLIDVKDSASDKKDPRSLKKSLKIINEGGKPEKKSDPNEIFSPEVIKTCKDPKAKGELIKKGVAANEVCAIYHDLQTCSNDFSIPVVALHNNTELAAKDKKDVKKAEKESTNIHRWKISKAIEKTVVGDKDNPDRVVWTSNPSDFKKLEKAGDINTALQDKNFKDDTDLSTLFNAIPEISALENPDKVNEIAAALVLIMRWPPSLTNLLAKNIYMELKDKEARYINIETEHKKKKYEQNLAEVDLEFVHDVLSKLGLWCCDESLDMKKLKGDLKKV